MPGHDRYTIRANFSGGGYRIWDAEKDAVASSPDGSLQYAALRLHEAFDLIDQLSEQDEQKPSP